MTPTAIPSLSPAALSPAPLSPTNAEALASHRGDFLLLVAPGLIWGASFLFIAEGLEAVGPNGVTFLRLLIGVVTLALFPAARKALPREDWSKAALLGVVWFAIPLSLFPYAEQRVSSALAGMLNGAVPLATAVVASLLARKLPSRGILIGLGVGLGGAALMAIPSFGEGASSTAGVLMILVALVFYGIAPNIARPLQQRHGALPVILRAELVALGLTAPMGLPEALQGTWSPAPVLSLLALGALGTGAANVLLTTAAGRFGATKASATTFLIPGVALILGVLVRNESVAWLAVAGAGLCVAGAWLMRRASGH